MFSGRTAKPLFLAAEGAFSPPLFLFLALFEDFLAEMVVGAAAGAGSEFMTAIGIGCWRESSSMTLGGGIEDVDEDDSSDGGRGSEGKFIFAAFLLISTQCFRRKPDYLTTTR